MCLISSVQNPKPLLIQSVQSQKLIIKSLSLTLVESSTLTNYLRQQAVQFLCRGLPNIRRTRCSFHQALFPCIPAPVIFTHSTPMFLVPHWDHTFMIPIWDMWRITRPWDHLVLEDRHSLRQTWWLCQSLRGKLLSMILVGFKVALHRTSKTAHHCHLVKDHQCPMWSRNQLIKVLNRRMQPQGLRRRI